jgi:cobalamin biosynthesis protein CobC
MKSAPVTMPDRPVVLTPSGTEAPESLFIHGGNLAVAKKAFPDAPLPWIDLSTGINPIAYPVGSFSPASLQRLPEENAVLALETAACEAYGGTDPAAIVAANGTQALIELLPRLFPARRVGILGFTYAEHEKMWRRAGAEVETVSDIEALSAFDCAVIVNPNNPDGRFVPVADLRLLAERMARRGGRLIVDEAFVDVLYDGSSLIPYLPESGAIVLRSFGKTYGLAGVRLGFAAAGAEDAAALRDALGLWSLSGPALDIGYRALQDKAWLSKTRERLIGDAVRLDRTLSRIGLKVEGGTPLFRLASSPRAELIFRHLAEAGILVRAFKAKPEWLRVGLPGDADEWALFEERVRTL